MTFDEVMGDAEWLRPIFFTLISMSEVEVKNDEVRNRIATQPLDFKITVGDGYECDFWEFLEYIRSHYDQSVSEKANEIVRERVGTIYGWLDELEAMLKEKVNETTN